MITTTADIDPQVRDWIADNAVPLRGVEAGIGFDDLAPLRDWLGGTRVVGLGEATHGTREFFQLKHRLFEYLVTELGYNLFFIEAPFARSLAVNRYVLTGDGDPVHSLASMPHDCWSCAEVAELIEWMRAWNATHDRKVYFYGCDPGATMTASSVMFLLDYLGRRLPAAHARLRDALLPFATDAHFTDWILRSAEEKEHARSVIADVRAALADVTATSAEERYELGIAGHQATVFEQHVEWWQVPGLAGNLRMGLRDRCMAANVAELLDLHGPDAKGVVWAHNGHVALRPTGPFLTEPPTGGHLRERFGDEFFVFGFAFDSGGFTANDQQWQSRECTVPSVPDTLGSVFAAAGPPVFAINLHAATEGADAWLAGGPPARMIGGGYWPEIDDLFWVRTDQRQLFDALLFVRTTTASRRRPDTSYDEKCAHEATPSTGGPANLDFAAGVEHWQALPQPVIGAYAMDIVTDDGGRRLEITRHQRHWPWDVCALWQTAAANPWRGKRITVRCAVSFEADHDGSNAQLAIRVRDGQPGPDTIEMPATHYERIAWRRAVTRDASTTELAITRDVGDAAVAIDIGLVMTGDGRARFGPLTIDIETRS